MIFIEIDSTNPLSPYNYLFDAVVSYAERGALLFRQDGSTESAAQLLEKAAKIVVATDPEKAIGIYLKAADTVGLEDEPRKAIDHIAMAARLQVSVCQLPYYFRVSHIEVINIQYMRNSNIAY